MIRKKNIRSLKPYAALLPRTSSMYVGLINPSHEKLKRIGFVEPFQDGDTVLPTVVGTVSRFNAEGKEIVHKDRPMETAHRTIEWTWTEWHGRDSIERTDFRDRSYQRYPRTNVAAPGVELTLTKNLKGELIVFAPVIDHWSANQSDVLHTTNLLLEIFGEAAFFDDKQNMIFKAPVRRLNWRVLPKGKHPFSTLKSEMEEALKQVKPGNRNFIDARLERINSYEPDFAAIGEAGFNGYVIFGFSSKNIFVLESILYGNATYVLGENWETLAKMSKAVILNNGLHKDRIIHNRSWFRKVLELLGNKPRPS